MRAKTKTVLKGFDYMHCDDFAKYLSDMAAKGWHFKEWGVGLKFEKGEPEHAVYAIEVFTKASEDDMRPEPKTQEFAEYCEAAGWKFIDAKQKFCIFKKIDEHAVELFTPEERVNNAFKGTFSGQYITLFLLSGLNALLNWVNLNSFFERNIFAGTHIFGISVWTTMFLMYLILFASAFWKRMTLRKAIREGKQIYIGNCQDGKYHWNLKDVYAAFLIVLLTWYFCMMDKIGLVILNVAIIVVTIGFSVIINKIRPEREANIIVQIVFAIVLVISIIVCTLIILTEDDNTRKDDIIPLVMADYKESGDVIEDMSYSRDSNFLGSAEIYFIFGKETSIYYHIYKSEHAWILDKIWKEQLEEKKYNEELVDYTEEWGARQAWRNKIGIYYVRYEDSILVFSDDEDIYLTTDQINIILEKLDLR